MPSLGSLLSIAGSSLRAQQRAMEVTSHNLANVNTEGYARKRAQLEPRPPLVTPAGRYGTGVSVTDVVRLSDVYAEAGVRSETGFQERHQARATLLERVEGVVARPDDQGLPARLDAFFSAWSELSVDPGSTVARGQVLEEGSRLASELNAMDTRLATIRSDAESQLASTVGEVNDLAEQVASLNRRIVAGEAGGNTAGDLRDARGRVLDRLSALVPLTTIQEDSGAVAVVVEGARLVDGTNVQRLVASTSGGDVEVQVENGGNPLALSGGSLRGIQDVLNNDLPAWQGRLDEVAAALVDQVNTLHQQGTNAAGDTGVDFFDPTGVTAGSIGLDAGVEGDPDAVAAGTGTADPTPLHRPGANDISLALGQLRDDVVPALGDTFAGTVADLAADVGGALRGSRDSARAHETLVEQWTLRKESVAGVSVDEELMNLVKFQAAYSAAARVVTAADEMIDTVLRM